MSTHGITEITAEIDLHTLDLVGALVPHVANAPRFYLRDLLDGELGVSIAGADSPGLRRLARALESLGFARSRGQRDGRKHTIYTRRGCALPVVTQLAVPVPRVLRGTVNARLLAVCERLERLLDGAGV